LAPSILAASLLTTSFVQVLPATSTATAASTGPGITWLAAGDSYASGQGLPSPAGACAQGTGAPGAGSAWSIVAAQLLGRSSFASGSPDLVACTGAISDEFFHSHTGLVDEIPLNKSPHGPQWTTKMGQSDLVSFSFGGDDIGFASILQHCVVTSCPPDAAVRDKIAELGSSGVYKGSLHIPSFPTFLNHVATAAVVSGGNVIVMGYPEVFEKPSLWGPKTTSCGFLTAKEINMARGWAGDLNATLGASVTKVNAEPSSERHGVHFSFINPVTGGGVISSNDPNLYEPATGTRHELCSQGNANWVNGLVKGHEAHSFHPNQAGETAMGHLVAEVMARLDWPTPPFWRQIEAPSDDAATGDAAPQLSCVAGPYCLESDAGTSRVWNGSTWTQAPASPASLDYLSCASSTMCMGLYVVEGNEDTNYAIEWNGKHWSAPVELDSFAVTPDSNGPEAISCTSATFCMVTATNLGGSSVWNGSTWHKASGATTGTDGGTALSCTSSTFCMATPAAPYTLEWNGTSWGSQIAVLDGNSWYASVACVSPTSCYAPGIPNAYSNGAQPWHFDGKTWSAGVAVNTPTTASISCASSGLCAWFSGGTQVETLSSSKWSSAVTLPLAGPGEIDGLSCGPTFCMVLSGSSAFLFSSTLVGTAVGSAAPTTPASSQSSSASSSSGSSSSASPVLGTAAWADDSPDVIGFGQVAPSTIDIGSGDASGVLQDVTWTNWGSPEALGTGKELYYADPNLSMAQQPVEPIDLVASGLSSCAGGPPAYTALNWYFPTEGQVLNPATALNACTGPAGGASPGGPAVGSSTGNSGAGVSGDTGSGVSGNTGSTGNTGSQSSGTGGTGSTGNTGNT